MLLAFAAVAPVVLHGADRAWQRQQNRVEDWLPKSFAEVQQLDWFAERFGGDEYLAISWEGCRIDDPRVPALVAALSQDDDSNAPPAWFQRVIDGPSVLASLRQKPISLSERLANERLRGWLLGRDNQTTCLIALVSEAGAADRHAAVESVWRAADRVEGLSRETIKLAGPTYNGVAIDRASRRSLAKFNYLSWAISIIVLLFCLRSFRLALQVFASAWVAEMASLAVMHYSGSHLDSVLLLAANLTFVLVIAGGVHLIHYIAEATRTGDPTLVAIAGGWRTAVKPCLLAAGTTCLGMASLLVSRLPPVRSFGGFAAASVLVGALIVLTALPCAIAVLPPKRWPRQSVDGSAWGWLTALTTRRRGWLLMVACVLLALGAAGAQRLQTTASLEQLFQPDAGVLEDRRWFREHLGEIVPIEIVLRWPLIQTDGSPSQQAGEFLRRLYVVDQVGDELVLMPEVDAIVEASSFLPPLPIRKSRRLTNVAARGAYAGKIYKEKQQFVDSGFYLQHDGEELWRVSARVSGELDGRYDEFLGKINQLVDRIAQEHQPNPSYVICGGVPVVQKTQRQLLVDLTKSFGTAVTMIAVIMVAVQRSLLLGALMLIPNLLPIAIVFGVFGWRDIEIEIGTVLTASVALGIAVDDSLHYLMRFRHAISRGLTIPESLRTAYRECGSAMAQTTAALVLGLSVFAGSSFTPICRFAWVMMSLLGLALLADLLVLPALLTLTHSKTPAVDQKTLSKSPNAVR